MLRELDATLVILIPKIKKFSKFEMINFGRIYTVFGG